MVSDFSIVPVQRKSERPAAKKSSTPSAPRGMAVQFWIHDEDKQRIHELRKFLANNDKLSSNSMIIRAALRAVKPDSAFLKAYGEAEDLDGRLKQHRPS